MLFITVVFSLGLLYALGLRMIWKRGQERLEVAQLRLRLSNIVQEESGLEQTLTGWRGTTRFQLVSRLLGASELRVSIEAPLPNKLSLTPQSRMSSSGRAQDIQIGLPVLDERFQVQCANPAAAVRYLRDERTRRALRGLLASAPDAVVTEGEVRLKFSLFEAVNQFESKARAAIESALLLAEAALPEGAPRPTEASPAAAPPVQVPVVQVSAEHLRHMRLEFGRRRLWLWYVRGAALATLIVVQLGLSKGLFPSGTGARGGTWAVVLVFLVLAVCEFLLDRCPACSARLYRRGQGSEHLVRLWNQRVKCPECGIQLR
jgi:hypothetical protein